MEDEPVTQSRRIHATDPASPVPTWRVVAVGWWALFMAVMQACRGALWVGLQETWQEVPMQVSPWALAAMSFLWAVIFGVWTWGWWTRRSWAWKAFPGVVMGYLGYQWFDRLVLSASPLVARDTPFALFRTLVAVGFVLWVWRHPPSRACFGRRER